MSSETHDELLRLLAERNTVTRRTPATLLLLRERPAGRSRGSGPERVGESSRLIQIDSSQQGQIRSVVRAMDAAFSARRSVVLELLSAPHPSLYALLEQASESATYEKPAAVGSALERATIPAACLIVVIAARELVESQINHPGFYNLFEVVECF